MIDAAYGSGVPRERLGVLEGKDDVESPEHYTMGRVECVEAIESATAGREGYEGYLSGNVIKYVWRYPFKGGAQDIRKAMRYLGMLLEAVESREDGAE